VSDTKQVRIYSGEKEARDVVGWLNFQFFENEQLRRVRRMLEKVTGKRLPIRQEQRRVIEILRLYGQDRMRWKNMERYGQGETKSSEEERAAYRKLDSRLRRYKFYPRFFPLGRFLSFEWIPIQPDRADRYGEVSAIADLAKLAEKDLLDHLRECHCGRWFWARFSHQRFCSAKCREKEFRSSPEWKEHRRKKAREYYRLHKTKNVR
jgi:hypothetical protein